MNHLIDRANGARSFGLGKVCMRIFHRIETIDLVIIRMVQNSSNEILLRGIQIEKKSVVIDYPDAHNGSDHAHFGGLEHIRQSIRQQA